MKDLLLYLVSNIVDNPKETEIIETENMGATVYTIKLKKEDMGKVIGKEGKIIHAIRNLAKVLAIKDGKQVRIELTEP